MCKYVALFNCGPVYVDLPFNTFSERNLTLDEEPLQEIAVTIIIVRKKYQKSRSMVSIRQSGGNMCTGLFAETLQSMKKLCLLLIRALSTQFVGYGYLSCWKKNVLSSSNDTRYTSSIPWYI